MLRKLKKHSLILCSVFCISYLGLGHSTPLPTKHIILFIWDGLRPDSISANNTPNLYRIQQQGVWFRDNHSTYPTLTMMNAASFATGDRSGKTGFYGNTLWDPRAQGIDAQGNPVDFSAPVFTEDYRILLDLNQPEKNDPLFFVSTLFSVAQQAGISTTTLGKSGPAFMQDYQQRVGLKNIDYDEKHAYPLEFAERLQKENYPLPKYSPLAFEPGQLTLLADNGDPTAFEKINTLKVISGQALGLKDDFMFPDNQTPDPSAARQSPYSSSNNYLMDTYLNKILPTSLPTLSVVWLRNPDTTEHNYGIGSPAYYQALHDQDLLLGKLIAKLAELNLLTQTDLIIASDHGHSNVSGPLEQFPLRIIQDGVVSATSRSGYSASGDFRPADLLTRAGLHAFDGQGCQYDPVLSGIKANGQLVYPIQVDRNGSVCGTQQPLHLYTTPSYKIPTQLPNDAIIVVGNGGSSYFYVANHDRQLVKKVVRYLQSRQEFGAIFVDDRYAKIPGTLPMSLVGILNAQNRNPDIIAGHHYETKAKISGMAGIEFNAGGLSRGMHGSFSPIDVHNTLLAIGPDFKTHFIDPLPTGNVDVAPTIAHLLQLSLPNTDGRVLLEALKHGKKLQEYSTYVVHVAPSEPATGLHFQLATDPNGADIDFAKTKFTSDLQMKLLIVDGTIYNYFDFAQERRY